MTDEPCRDPTEMEVYSDVEELLEKEAKKKRKSSSRSVNVSAPRLICSAF